MMEAFIENQTTQRRPRGGLKQLRRGATMEQISAQLAKNIVTSRPGDVPDPVHAEATRALLNYVGCALGGSRHPAVDITIEALGPYAGPPTAHVLGRRERYDPLLASLLNGISSHVHDFDDTTPSNYIHPTSPVASALFAYASLVPVSGRDFVHAFVLGFECITRIGNATYPAHYEAGWHSTGSVGVFGAAVAIGRLLELDEEQMLHAIGLAATQSSGLRDMFGSMGKAFHPGRAAQSGYASALLAKSGFTSGRTPLEGSRGFAAVEAGEYDLSGINQRFGKDWLLHTNTYKPYPCGIVVHPTIDACIQLRTENSFDPAGIDKVRLRVAPLVRDLCDKSAPASGLEGKFSIYHAAAIGLVRGKARLEEFSDEAVADPALQDLRGKVEPIATPGMSEDAVAVEVVLKSGETLHKYLEHSLGNLKRPLSDAQLEDKFRDQVKVIDPGQVENLMRMCRDILNLEDVRHLIAAAVPAPH
jgi:2-methylcitrate dehydratase PrpD